jgi:tyrosine-protein kinase Etk/Wzc
METNQRKSDEFNAIDILSFLWKYRKITLVLGVLAAIVSSIVSLIIQERFKSTVVLYPTKASSIIYSDKLTNEQDPTAFGEKEATEQMLQILESSMIRDKVVAKFDLMNHYEIDTSSQLKLYYLNETYKDFIIFDRNSKGAVLINVYDRSPDTAMYIAAYIADLYDSARNQIIQEKAVVDYKIKKSKLEKLFAERQSIQDTMAKLTQLGVVTFDGYEGLVTQLINAKTDEEKKVTKKKLEMTELYGSALKSYEMQLEFLEDRIATMASVYEQSETNAFESISHKFTIESASLPVRKAYPVRWLIVVVSTIATVFLTLVLLLFYEKIKELQEQERQS